MPKNLHTLVAEAVEHFDKLAKIQQLLVICIEELEEHSEESQSRVKFLLELCLSHADVHFDELGLALIRIQSLLGIED